MGRSAAISDPLAALFTIVAEAAALCPVSRLFAGAKISVDAVIEPGS